MKTYVAQEVLCDYTCGIVIVRAENIEEAKRKVSNFGGREWSDCTIEEVKSKLHEMTDAVIAVWGGG